MSSEFAQLAETLGWGLDDFEWVTMNAVKSAFAPFDERVRLIEDVVVPRYAELRATRG
jgi:adenosine deaminase